MWDGATNAFLHHRHVTLGGAGYAFPGVGVALWGGGLITLAAGWWARRCIGHAHRMRTAERREPAGAGAT